MKSDTSLPKLRGSNAHSSCSRGEGQTPSLERRGIGTRSLGASYAHPDAADRTNPTPGHPRAGGSARSHHHAPQRTHNHALVIEGHGGLQHRWRTTLELRSRKYERSPLTSAASVHTVRHALRRILGSCGAEREAHRQHRWMDGRVLTDARGVPCSHHQPTKYSFPATAPLIRGAPATGQLSAVERARLRRLW